MSAAHKLGKALRVLAAADRRWLGALRMGVAPSLEHLRVLRLMKPETVVDLGANRGQFALAARHCYPAAAVYSFEPLPEPAGVFQRVFAGDRRTQLFQTAIGPSSGAATIHVSERDDSSSLLPITDTQTRIFPGTAEARMETIRVGALDEFLKPEQIRPPALLKLDVQGFELSALRGCEALLGRFAQVYVECSFVELYAGQALADEVIAWLRERGFMLRGVYNMAYAADGSAVQADFLFVSMESDSIDHDGL